MGLQNERFLQQLLTQDHKKPLEELVELARVFEAAEHESLKRVDLDKKQDNVTATKSKATGGVRNKKATQRSPNGKSHQLSRCASCGGEHSRSSCHFCNVKC